MFDFNRRPNRAQDFSASSLSFGSGGGTGMVAPPAPGQAFVPAAVMSTGGMRNDASQSSAPVNFAAMPNIQTGGAQGNQRGFLSGIGGIEGLGTIMDGIGSLGQLWASLQAVKMGKQQFNFQKEAYEKNLGNQTQTYNTALTDRATARGHTQNQSADETAAYIDQHRLR